MRLLPQDLRQLENSGTALLDLGCQPVSNRFLPKENGGEAPRFPLQLRLRADNALIHLKTPFPLEEVRPRYEWLTCFEPEAHLDELVQKIVKLPGISEDSLFGAYSFKDDTTLRRLEKSGYLHTWRIEPDRDLNLTDHCASVETFQSVLTVQKANSIAASRGKADVFIARHVLEHAYDLPEFLASIQALTKPQGYIVFELPDCTRALEVNDYTTIWEEHIFYFTCYTLRRVLRDFGFNIIHFESVPYPFENSIIAIVQFSNHTSKTEDEYDQEELHKEINRASQFAENLQQRRFLVQQKLKAFHAEQGKIALFGAGHLACAFLSIMDVGHLIEVILDDNPHKSNMLFPIQQLPIFSSDELFKREIKLCLLSLNPQNQEIVIQKNSQFIEAGGLFASIFPDTPLALEKVI